MVFLENELAEAGQSDDDQYNPKKQEAFNSKMDGIDVSFQLTLT